MSRGDGLHGFARRWEGRRFDRWWLDERTSMTRRSRLDSDDRWGMIQCAWPILLRCDLLIK